MAGFISFNVETTAWERTINVVASRTVKNFNASVYKASEELLNKIKNYTPIGNPNLWQPPYWPKNYIPGTLRASWEMNVSGLGTITISNPQPYADRVEHGWSTQAPEGMMRRAILEFPELVKRYSGEMSI